MDRLLIAFSLVCLALLAPCMPGDAAELNGFDLSESTIPAREILRGGPPRDGIPALDDPAVLPVDGADWPDDEWVVGVAWEGVARAYPLSVLVWHELVNDRVGGLPILVTYCPLCGSAMVFGRSLPVPGEGEGGKEEEEGAKRSSAAGTAMRFGVSGLLYQSDLLMFDRETESLWSQLAGRAISGPRRGQRLELLRSRIEPWARWRVRHPETTVLSRDTGHRRRYGQSPYGDYARSRDLYFPAPTDPRHHPKMRTLGLRLSDGTARAYPLAAVEQVGAPVEETFAGRRVRISVDPGSGAFQVGAPADVEVIETFWFAWMAFHPDSTVFTPPR